MTLAQIAKVYWQKHLGTAIRWSALGECLAWSWQAVPPTPTTRDRVKCPGTGGNLQLAWGSWSKHTISSSWWLRKHMARLHQCLKLPQDSNSVQSPHLIVASVRIVSVLVGPWSMDLGSCQLFQAKVSRLLVDLPVWTSTISGLLGTWAAFLLLPVRIAARTVLISSLEQSSSAIGRGAVAAQSDDWSVG